MSTISLAGAERGTFKPWREIPGGLYFEEPSGIVNKPCAVRLTTRRVGNLCTDYARQYLESRADKRFMPGQLGDFAAFLLAHYVLIHVPAADGVLRPMCPPGELADKTGKVNPAAIHALGLHSLADGQLEKLLREYSLLKETQTPDRPLTHEEWEALIAEGKAESLAILHSRHGSSKLIQLLHGLDGVQYPD